MLKKIRFLMVAAVLTGCSGSEDASTSTGLGGTGGAAGSAGASGSTGGDGTAGTGGTSSSGGAGSGGTGGVVCGSATLKPFDCAAKYPDPLLAYDPQAMASFGFSAAPGESPNGAAAGRVDVDAGVVVAVVASFHLGAVPSDAEVAVWQEPACGLPASEPPWQAVPPASVTTDAGKSTLLLPATVPLTPAAGRTWAAIRLTAMSVAIDTSNTAAGPHEPRFAWYGLVDLDCDGVNDEELGWEDIRTPSAIGVSAADVDARIGVVLQ